MYIPRELPKWDKEVDGIEPACKWVRSRLPADLVVPRAGQIWETVRDCQVNVRARITLPRPARNLVPGDLELSKQPEKPDWTSYMRQFSIAVLNRGERVRILQPAEPKPINIAFIPVRYHELHETIISAEIRSLSTYQGTYELSVKIARTISDLLKTPCNTYFNEDFRLVEDVA